jgi:phosphate transport system ATP-binding protein
LRSFNRKNDLIQATHVTGDVLLTALTLFVRCGGPAPTVGMVFQPPTISKTFFDNVAYGPRSHGIRDGPRGRDRERSLRQAALWMRSRIPG